MSKSKRAPLNLDAMKAKKPGADQARTTDAAKGESVKPDDAAKRKGLTIRLSPEAWEQLRLLGFKQRRPAHDILIESLNDYFRAQGLPPIA